MDYFTKNKMLFWFVIILVVINTASLGAFWVTKGPAPMHKPEDQANGQRIMEERLELTNEQAHYFEVLRNEHFRRTRPLHHEMHLIKLDIVEELFAEEPDEAKIKELLAELTSLQGQFDSYLFEHFKDLKDVCFEEQTEELKYMITDLIERTRPRGPEHHRGGPQEGYGPDRRGGHRPENMPPPRR